MDKSTPKRFLIGLAAGCILTFSIVLALDIQNPTTGFIIGAGCGLVSVSVALRY